MKRRKTKDEPKIKEVKIDFDGFEQRVVILPPAAGNYGNIAAVTGKVIYHRAPNSGSADKKIDCLF